MCSPNVSISHSNVVMKDCVPEKHNGKKSLLPLAMWWSRVRWKCWTNNLICPNVIAACDNFGIFGVLDAIIRKRLTHYTGLGYALVKRQNPQFHPYLVRIVRHCVRE